MSKKKEPTEKKLMEIFNWDYYHIDFVKLLKDDGDNNLDSYFDFSFFIYIKPDKTPKNKYLKETIEFIQQVKKEETFSFNELPDFFKSFYFDEINIEKFGKLHDGLDRCFFNTLKNNHPKALPLVTDIEIGMNSSGRRYREDTKTKRFLKNYFGLNDERFKYFLESLNIFNELMPSHALSRQEYITFFNGLEEYKNNLFVISKPDYLYEYDATKIVDGKQIYWKEKDEKHRFVVPFNRIKIKENLNIEQVLEIRNSLWGLIYPAKERNIRKYDFYGFTEHPFHYYFSELLSEYDYELQSRKIADKCWCCGDMFKYKKGKRYCSYSSEGKDCGKKYRNYKDYFRHHNKRKISSKRYMSEYRTLLKKHGISSK